MARTCHLGAQKKLVQPGKQIVFVRVPLLSVYHEHRTHGPQPEIDKDDLLCERHEPTGPVGTGSLGAICWAAGKGVRGGGEEAPAEVARGRNEDAWWPSGPAPLLRPRRWAEL